MNQFKSDRVKPSEPSLLDEAVKQILSENYIEALSYLQSCESFLETCPVKNSNFMKLTTFHNSAVCLSRLGRLQETMKYLESGLFLAKKLRKKNENTVENLRIQKHLAVVQLQLCALCSQCKQHEKALNYSKNALKCMKELFFTLSILVSQFKFAQNIKANSGFLDVISKIAIILDRILSKNISKKMNIYAKEEWVHVFSIGNVMIIQPMLLTEWTSPAHLKPELSYAKILEKICILSANYFSIAAELRLISAARQSTVDFLISREWHDKALALCRCFLPGDSPLFVHILASHKKHYLPKAEIKETSAPPLSSKKSTEKSGIRPLHPLQKSKKSARSTTPLRKLTPPLKKKIVKNLKKTLKPSTRDLSAPRKTSEKSLKKNMGKSQKIQRILLSSSSENCIFYSGLSENFILNSNDLYGEYSIKDDGEQQSTVIKSLRKDVEID